MNSKELEKIEMRNDGKDSERFENLFRQVITVSKEELKRREEAEKQKNRERKVARPIRSVPAKS